MCGKGTEIFRLKLPDNVDGKFGLFSEGVWLASIVGPVPEFLAHETVSVMSIVWGLSDVFIVLEVTGPAEVWPAYTRNCRVRVARFTDIEVSPIAEKVPFNCADAEGFAGLRVTLCKLHPGVSDKDGPQRFLNVLQVSSSSEFRDRTGKPSC